MTISTFKSKYQDQVIGLICGIQQNEFDLPITEADQPDLRSIGDYYQHGVGDFWVALDGNQVIGTIALLDIGGQRGALRKMFVDRNYRGNEKGVARSLLKNLLDSSREKGAREIFLGTTSQFAAAHRFYEKNGFQEIRQSDLPERFPVMKIDSKFYQMILS